MGNQPPENIIDAEILSLVRLLNTASFIETNNSCSGYSTDDPERSRVSDGKRRKWKGSPYIQFMVIGDDESRGKCLRFVDYLISKLNFHTSEEAVYEDQGHFRNTQRYEVQVSYSSNGFTLKIMDWACIDTIGGKDIIERRSPEEIMKIWILIELVTKDFLVKEAR